MAGLSQLPPQQLIWQKLTKQHDLTGKTLHSAETASGSQVKMPQFLLLRVLYRTGLVPNDLLRTILTPAGAERLVSNDIWIQADRFLSGLGSWKKYKECFKSSSGQDGAFHLVRYYQQLTTRNPEETMDDPGPKVVFSPRQTRSTTNRNAPARSEPNSPTPAFWVEDDELGSSPTQLVNDLSGLNLTDPDLDTSDPGTPDPGTPPEASILSPHSPLSGDVARLFKAIEDEQIVNTALILFLNALTIDCPEVKSEWSLYRCPFVLKDLKGRKVYEARVDGLLRTKNKQDHSHTQALIEVKPYLRNGKRRVGDAIRMQEAAQMAAWISQCPPSAKDPNITEAYRRLLISQDRNEIYITIGSFDTEYVRYVRGERPKKDSFLTMTEYGPFDVNNLNQMRYLGKIMLAVSLQGGVM